MEKTDRHAHLDMECSCGEEGKKGSEELLAKTIKFLDPDDKQPEEHAINRGNIVTQCVYALNWDYSAHYTEIHNDMWSSVSAETYAQGDDGKPLFRVYVECDLIEDGFMAILHAFAERFPEQNSDDPIHERK